MLTKTKNVKNFFLQVLLYHVCFIWIWTPINRFFDVSDVSSYKNNCLIQLRKWRTLFTSSTHVCKHLLCFTFYSTLPGCCNFMETRFPIETWFIISQSKVSVVKNLYILSNIYIYIYIYIYIEWRRPFQQNLFYIFFPD